MQLLPISNESSKANITNQRKLKTHGRKSRPANNIEITRN